MEHEAKNVGKPPIITYDKFYYRSKNGTLTANRQKLAIFYKKWLGTYKYLKKWPFSADYDHLEMPGVVYGKRLRSCFKYSAINFSYGSDFSRVYPFFCVKRPRSPNGHRK